MQTDLDRIQFLLETEAGLTLGEDLRTEGKAEEGERPAYKTSYLGSKQKLVDWIWKHTPDGVKIVFDAFAGSAAVGYMYKTKGLQVIASDRLRISYHMARAIIENQKTRLSDEDVAMLLAANADAGTFVRNHFKGMYFNKGVHERIDTIRSNIDKLKGYKKDLALFALVRTCMLGTDHGHFGSRTPDSRLVLNAKAFDEGFQRFVKRINQLVFDNGQDNRVIQGDIESVLPQVKADLVYFDPPYATEFSAANYTAVYHFVEGLMTYWKGMALRDTALKTFETDHKAISPKTAPAFFEKFLGAAQHIPIWLISYRDKAFPNESQMRGIFAKLGRTSTMRSKDHKYNLFNKRASDANQPKERLFLATRDSAKSKADVEIIQLDGNGHEEEPQTAACHTEFPVEIELIPNAPLKTSAEQQSPLGDPQFRCVLCRVGTNKNGDHFSHAELSTRYTTAINKKVDLKHSQEFDDIVGGIIGSDFVEDDQGARVEVVGELYLAESAHAALAYKLMKRGIVRQVSMECDYAEGECSVCHKRFGSKANYCIHLAKFKGAQFQGQPVYEILHGVTFTGLGLLDRKGADENAKITQVGSEQSGFDRQPSQGEDMEDKAKDHAEAAKDPGDGGGGGTGQPESLEQQNRALQEENKKLKQQVQELTKRIEELEAEQKAAANRVRAEKLLAQYAKKGVSFSTDEARKKELDRLAGLSDEAFAATEAALAVLPEPSVPKAEKEPEKAKTEAPKAAANLSTEAQVRPHDVDDTPASLEDELTQGFMAAYRERLGFTASGSS
ncbi:DNA adenine methylase [Sulfidibacter corallicola]|nr:DNA adenine methylase [Sulfidibacter corallicola]